MTATGKAARTLTLRDLVNLSTVVDTAIHGDKIAFMINGHKVYGTARGICDERGDHLVGDEDVDTAYLQISTQGGIVEFIPAIDLAELAGRGEFSAVTAGKKRG